MSAVVFTKVSVSESHRMRKEYDMVRSDFVRYLAETGKLDWLPPCDLQHAKINGTFRVPNISIHHIIPLAMGGNNDFSNMVILPYSIHSDIHSVYDKMTDGLQVGQSIVVQELTAELGDYNFECCSYMFLRPVIEAFIFDKNNNLVLKNPLKLEEALLRLPHYGLNPEKLKEENGKTILITEHNPQKQKVVAGMRELAERYQAYQKILKAYNIVNRKGTYYLESRSPWKDKVKLDALQALRQTGIKFRLMKDRVDALKPHLANDKIAFRNIYEYSLFFDQKAKEAMLKKWIQAEMAEKVNA